MPPATHPRQPESLAKDWFDSKAGRLLAQQVQRQTISELTRVFGHSGLYLRPCESTPTTLSGNMLARIVNLHRQDESFTGDLRCADQELPVATASMALVYGLFVLETSANSDGLLSEIARILKPEGVALFLSLNPLSPYRARWALRGLQPISAPGLGQKLKHCGLEVGRQRSLGPIWSGLDDRKSLVGSRFKVLAPLRAVTLTIARRRDPGLNAMRQSSPGIRLHRGVSAG